MKTRQLYAAVSQALESLESRQLLSTYYVSTTGSDSAAGTSDAAAFKTLQHAADTVKAGDIVIVRAGTYVGMNLYGRTGGTSASPIKFLADSGVKVTHVSSSGVNASLADINIENAGGWWVIQGFDVESDGSAQRAGIRVTGTSNVQILNNTVNKGFIGIFTSNGDNLLVQGNICHNSTDQHGIYMSANEHNCVVRGNTLYGNNWDGLHMNASNALGPNDGALVEDNVIYGNGLAGMDIEGVTNAVYRNNIIYGNTKHGITMHSADQTANGDPTPATAGNTFVENTIVNNGMFGIQMQSVDTAETIFDNILISNNSTYGSIGVSGTPTGLHSDYNVVVDNFSTNLGTSQMTLASWRSQTGLDTHSIIATTAQLFVNAAANDYHLKTGSPAIDAGTASYNSMSPAPADFDGNARPGAAAYDIGAYEVPGADLVPPTIIAKGPSASATSVAISSAVTATFSEDITADSLIFVLKDGSNNIVNASVSYDTNTRVATLTPAAALNSSTTYTVTVSGAQDPSGNTMSPVTWTFTTAAPDTTRPTVTGKTPAANATGVAAGTKVTVTFSEAVQPDTITFVLKDANNNIVAASVSYDDATQTATLTPNVSLGYGATYTATVTAQDLANNAMAAPVSWSFSTVSLGTGPFSLFPSNPKPGTVDDSDTNSTEVGVKFYSDVAGTVTGVRFYKGSLNTGTHVGHLWDANGNLLGTVTFTGETASGWQTATFATPIAINANQIYVVSYLAPKGQYAEDDDYFDTTGVDSAPLHAPVSGGAYGVNGVYAYSTGNVFPTATYANANYYVDVVFSPGGTADTTPPSVTGQTPASGATSVAVTSRPTVTFSESVQAGTISFVLKDANNNTVAASVSYNDTTHTVTLTPTASLSTSATYTLKISGAKDQAGNVMSAPVSWTFTTAAAADTTPPTVSGKTPSNGATGTAITSKPTVTFSESVQQATISFVLKDANNNTIAGTVTYNDTSHKATFTPSASLAYSTTYTLTVSGAKDQAGNVMVGSVSWSFTTAAAPDTTPPTVTGKSPASGATGVAVAVDPTVTFSEAVQAGTISFVLKDGNNNTIAATVTYDANTHTATLSPTADLTASSTYTLTVSSATDTAGNVMSAPVSWSFTTAAASVATIGFNTPTISVNENAGTATIIVTRSGNTSNAVSVNFATSDGTAVAGVNYTAASGTLNFGVGETSKTFVVTVLDDGAASDDLTVNLTLSSPTNGAVISGGLGTAQLTIVNTDTAPVVDPGVDATAVKVAYGSDGTLYLAYIDSAGNLNFQSEDTQGNWSAAQTIDAGVKSGSSFSLAVDPSGNPGIAYYDAVNGDLDYAHFNGSAWDVSLPDYYKTTGLTPSLTYMSNGQPLIAYYDSYYGQLRLANQVNSKWALFVVDSGNVGLNASISYDPVVNAYGIGYENVKTGALKYATYYRKNFRTSTIDATTTGGVSDISIKINPLTHNPAMSYFDVQHTQLGYAAYTGAWSVTRVTTARSQGQSSSLNFDASGQAEILYYTASYGAINKATVSNSLWSLTRVISGGAGFSEAVGPGGLDTICWVDGSGLEFLSV